MNSILSTEFEFIDQFEIDYIGFHLDAEVYRSKQRQFLIVYENRGTGMKTITFHGSFEEVSSVYSDDLEKDKMQSWNVL